jgi:hypothetical protein
MKKRDAVKNRRDGKSTEYYFSVKATDIPNLGSFPRRLEWIWGDHKDIRNKYKLAVITADFIYYVDEQESDENASTVMLTRDFQLISDNFFAANDLTGLVASNEGILWMSKAIKYWQKEQFIRPSLLSGNIIKMLTRIDIEQLTKPERIIFLAYFTDGPVTYTKAQSLMAVLSNDLAQEQWSDPLAAVEALLPKDR